jgi:hypothetical protein
LRWLEQDGIYENRIRWRKKSRLALTGWHQNCPRDTALVASRIEVENTRASTHSPADAFFIHSSVFPVEIILLWVADSATGNEFGLGVALNPMCYSAGN